MHNQRMDYKDILAYYGTAAHCGRRIGLRRQAVHRWKQAGIPVGRQFQIEVESGGRLRAVAMPVCKEAPHEDRPG